MKKYILSLLFLTGMLVIVNAQTPTTIPTVAGDSLVNADTVFKKISVSAGYASMGIQVSIKKGTGTLDGKFYLYTSLNGGDYVLTDSASFTAVPSFSGGLATTSNTHTAYISKTAPAGAKYIAAATQSGSLTSSPVIVTYVLRKHD